MAPRHALIAVALVACGARPAAPPTPRPAPREAPCDASRFELPAEVQRAVAERIAKKRGSMARASKTMVVSSHRLATEAGLAVLRDGGTAADAFVAAVLVEDVVFPGVTSTAGLAGITVYDARTKKVTYLHGGLGDPIEPARRWKPGDTASGKRVLVPGAPAAYAALVRMHGKKPLRDLVEPAATYAEAHAIDPLFAGAIAASAKRLEGSSYFAETFFRAGKPLGPGEVLKRPELAATLRAYGKDPTYFHEGAWPKDAVTVANAAGGSLAVEDFATYAGVETHDALHARFAGRDVHAGGYGGMKLLVGLARLERLRRGERAEAPSSSLAALERIVAVHRAVEALPALRDRDVGDDAAAWSARVPALAAADPDATLSPDGGSHSSAVVVVDAEGNVVVGTHTIQALPWGDGLFVGGVPLSTSAHIGLDDAPRQKKRMRIDSLTDTIVVSDGAPVAALAVYGTGLHPADLQILDGVLARGLDAEPAVLEPRVGFFRFDIHAMKADTTIHDVDPRFDPQLLCRAARDGFELLPSTAGMPAGYVDTGFPTLVAWRDGELHGMPPDPAHIDGLAKGD